MIEDRAFVSFAERTPAGEMLAQLGDLGWQGVFPVLNERRQCVGIVSATAVRILAIEREGASWILAADVMQPPVRIHPGDELRTATELMIANTLREDLKRSLAG
jgi:CBS domain-containing protein